MMAACLDIHSVCCITGLSQHTLAKLNDGLSVDRIDANVGYVLGNCQLMARSLNLQKGQGDVVPAHAIVDLVKRAHKLVKSRHDQTLQT